MIRDASGCKTEDPIPIKNTEIKTQWSVEEKARFNKPTNVKLIPIGNDQATGRLSKTKPVIGWKTEADN